MPRFDVIKDILKGFCLSYGQKNEQNQQKDFNLVMFTHQEV